MDPTILEEVVPRWISAHSIWLFYPITIIGLVAVYVWYTMYFVKYRTMWTFVWPLVAMASLYAVVIVCTIRTMLR